MSRTHLHCSANQLIRRGRWYSYSAAGRVSRVSYASMTGSTYSTPNHMDYTYTAGGKLISYTSPLNAVMGTTVAAATTGGPLFDAETGNPMAFKTTAGAFGATLVKSMTFQALGPMASMTTGVSYSTTFGTTTLQLDLGRRLDGALNQVYWYSATPSAPPISGVITSTSMRQQLAYTKAGFTKSRSEIALSNKSTSRYYDYDALMRLTCEARGSSTAQPTSADCVSTDAQLAGLFNYHDGANAAQPPDVRNVSRIHRPGYANAAAGDAYSYAGGSGKIVNISRGGNNLVLAHDVAGRRTRDEDSFDAARSRRDYTYLPRLHLLAQWPACLSDAQALQRHCRDLQRQLRQ
jgi:hypothetical protein